MLRLALPHQRLQSSKVPTRRKTFDYCNAFYPSGPEQAFRFSGALKSSRQISGSRAIKCPPWECTRERWKSITSPAPIHTPLGRRLPLAPLRHRPHWPPSTEFRLPRPRSPTCPNPPNLQTQTRLPRRSRESRSRPRGDRSYCWLRLVRRGSRFRMRLKRRRRFRVQRGRGMIVSGLVNRSRTKKTKGWPPSLRVWRLH